MELKIEKFLNFVIGLIVLSNLYYLAPLIGLNANLIIIFSTIISSIFFILRSKSKILDHLQLKLALSFITLSVLLLPLNLIIFDYDIRPNDLIRIYWYSAFLGWTFLLYRENKSALNSVISKWTIYLLAIIVVVSFFEYFFYNAFWQIIMQEPREWTQNIRLAGTYRDSNAFAGAISIYLYLYLRNKGFNIIGWIYFITAIILINLSGSRMGLLLIFLITINHLKETKLSLKTYFKFIIIILLFLPIGATFFINRNIRLKDKENTKSETIIDRLFNSSDKKRTQASTNQRISSIETGLKVGFSNNLILPPGNFLFESKWQKQTNARHYPHNSIIYALDEYGFFVLWPVYILFLIWRRAKKNSLKLLYFIMLIQILLLPNSIYYSSIYLVIFYIQYNNENSRNNSLSCQ